MQLRQAVIGVNNHDCWGSLSTESFPELSMKEKGPILVEKDTEGVALHAVWDVSFPKLDILSNYLESLKKCPMIKKIKVISRGDRNALLRTVWKNTDSSYDIVLNNYCLYSSPVTQKDGYEIYTVIAENPGEITRLVNEFSSIGQVKIFKAGSFQKEENHFTLTDKQLSVLQIGFTPTIREVD